MASVTFRRSPDWERGLGAQAESFLEGLGPQVVSEAYRAAPILTGELRESIGHSVAVEGGLPVLYIAAGLNGLAPYAAFVEYGTSRMRAQPYLRPAAFRRWV